MTRRITKVRYKAWRVEIRKYPQLLAGQRRPTLDEQAKTGCRCGLQTGFYTQADLRQIVHQHRQVMAPPLPAHRGSRHPRTQKRKPEQHRSRKH